MKIKKKITLASVCVGAISVISASFIMGWVSTDFGRSSLENAAKNQLISIREIKKTQIEDYFHFIEDQVRTFSNDRMIIDAMQEFSLAFHQYSNELVEPDYDKYNEGLQDYYQNQFLKRYGRVNDGASLDVTEIFSKFGNHTLALQHRYISDNLHPLGSKDELIDSGGQTAYEQTHKKYHPHIRDFLKRFEYYDIFLVDSVTGYIVYSVFKELDYATSLIDGPYANSGLAQAFNEANKLEEHDSVYLTDFKSYTPFI